MSARFEFLRDGRWDDVNSQATMALRESGFDTTGHTVQTFLGLSHAILEVITSLRRLYPNRNVVALEAGASARFIKLSHFLATEGFEVLWLSHAQMNEPALWLDKVSKSLLAVFTVYDHPVLDTIFDMSKIVQEAVARRFFAVRLTHAPQALKRLGRMQPNEVALRPIRHDLAILVAGERYRCRPLECEFLPWDGIYLSSEDLATPEERRAQVEAFEANLPPEFNVVKRKSDRPRIFHRSVIYSEEFEASALLELLALRLGIKLCAPGVESRLESTSLLRWSDPRLDEWLGECGLAPTQRRGLISIDAELLVHPDFKKALMESIEELKTLQSS